jgi:hypothetical protein
VGVQELPLGEAYRASVAKLVEDITKS